MYIRLFRMEGLIGSPETWKLEVLSATTERLEKREIKSAKSLTHFSRGREEKRVLAFADKKFSIFGPVCRACSSMWRLLRKWTWSTILWRRLRARLSSISRLSRAPAYWRIEKAMTGTLSQFCIDMFLSRRDAQFVGTHVVLSKMRPALHL